MVIMYYAYLTISHSNTFLDSGKSYKGKEFVSPGRNWRSYVSRIEEVEVRKSRLIPA